MPLQNRIDPYGTICFSDHRGTLMGNRGSLHNGQQQIVRPHQLKRWIICLLEFKGRHQQVMTPGWYTELFFLDEATALAAGHRPCGECQYLRFKEFKNLWKTANQKQDLDLQQIDEILHQERSNKDRPFDLIDQLPDGVFIEYQNQPFLVNGNRIWEWSFGGYVNPLPRPIALTVQVITPPSIVKTIAAGYVAGIHGSIV